MIKVEVEQFISRPPQEVLDYIANFENGPAWQSGITSARLITPPPLAVGSRYQQDARFMGRPIQTTFEVVEYQPGRMVKIDTVSGSFPITITRAVRAEGEGCVVSAIVEGEAGGFFKLAEPLLRRQGKGSVEADYQALRSLLEGRA
jgi:uncharacterized membrane protein